LQAEEEQRKCSLCESFEELSGDIARAKFLLLRKVEGKPTGELKWHSVLQAFGFEIWLNDEAETANNYQAGDWVFRLNEADLTPIRYAGKTVPVVGFRFLPQYSPMVGNQIRDLTELAEASKGAPYYGALRMDVDSLGRLFREGLGGMLSLSRLMTLSRSLAAPLLPEQGAGGVATFVGATPTRPCRTQLPPPPSTFVPVGRIEHEREVREMRQEHQRRTDSVAPDYRTIVTTIIMQGDYEQLVQRAEEWGRELAKEGLRMAQIRRVFGEVKRLSMRFDPVRLRMLKPRLAYIAARAGQGGQRLRDIFVPAINAVFDDPNQQQQRFRVMVDLFEAVLAYFYAAEASKKAKAKADRRRGGER